MFGFSAFALALNSLLEVVADVPLSHLSWQLRGMAVTNECIEPSSAKPARPSRRPTSVHSQRHFNDFRRTFNQIRRMRRSTMRRPIQPTDRPLEPAPTSSLLSCTPSTSRSVRSLQTEAFAGTRVGSTSARRWATSSSGSNPSVRLCGKSTSDPLPSGGLTKNSSSFSTPTVTQDVTQSVNHQLAPLCQPSGALFMQSDENRPPEEPPSRGCAHDGVSPPNILVSSYADLMHTGAREQVVAEQVYRRSPRLPRRREARGSESSIPHPFAKLLEPVHDHF